MQASLGVSPSVCAGRVEGFTRWLVPLLSQASFRQLGSPGESPLVSLSKAEPSSGQLLITLSTARVSLENQPVGEGFQQGSFPARDLQRALQAYQDQRATLARKLGREQPELNSAVVAPHRDARWTDIVATSRVLLDQGITRMGLGFSLPDRVKAPGSAAVDSRLIALRKLKGPAEKQRALADLWMLVLVKPCPASLRLFSRIGQAGPLLAPRIIQEELPPALLACQCALDLPSLKRLLLEVYHVARPVGVRWLTLGRTGARLSLSREARWAQVYGQVLQTITAGTGPILLTAR